MGSGLKLEGMPSSYHMQRIGEILREKNIQLDTLDPVARSGFTQVPNFILKQPDLSVGAKLTYAMFLSYAWHNESCFPGQERLAKDIGLSRSRVTEFIGELRQAGFITIFRRGLGKTNTYRIHFRVHRASVLQKRPDGLMSAHRHPDVGPTTSGGYPADFSLLKNTQIKNTQFESRLEKEPEDTLA
jgi:hypothetical protein